MSDDFTGVTTEDLEASWRARGWKDEQCFRCGGYGVVSDYSGCDFNGAKECESCGGSGFVWRTPSGKHYAMYPGGPFCA